MKSLKNYFSKILTMMSWCIIAILFTSFSNAITTGGNITIDGNYIIHTFTYSSLFNTTENIYNASILIVAGGGSAISGGGGAGAGGLIYWYDNLTITNNTYSAVVGLGGTTGDANGQNSSFNGLIAIGGGGGATRHANGGSGGGCSGGVLEGKGIVGQGNDAGICSTGYSGGGGAGAIGGAGNSTGGFGGVGRQINISGNNSYYAGGGAGYPNGLGGLGGGGNTRNLLPKNGLANTGGGGGDEGTGGSGIIIIRYLNTTEQPISYSVTTNNTPTNISTTTLNLTIIANITSNKNITANGNAIIFYGINTTLNNGCSIFYQNNCVKSNNFGNTTMTQLSNMSYSISLMDNEILPAYYPFNYNYMRNTTTFLDTIYSNNNLLFNITNFSTSLNYTLNLEFDAVNKTNVLSNLLIYYCNYSFILNVGNPSLRPNACELIDSYSATTNCSHYHGTRCDRAIPVIISNITKTQNSFIIFVGQSNALNGWDFGYVLNNSYDNSSFRFGNFNAFDSVSTKTDKIYQVHLHSYSSQDTFKYYVNYTNNGTTASSTLRYLFYNVSYSPPSASNFINPNCLNTSTLIYTIGSSNNYTLSWTTAQSQLKYNITYLLFYSDILDISRESFGNTTATNLTLNSSVMNGISGLKYFYVISSDGIATDEGKLGCTFNFCTNNWIKSVQPCINNVQLINYTDSNSCSEQYNLPSDNGQYESCTAITYVQNSLSEDVILLIILFVFLIISTLCGVMVHEAFFGLNALITAGIWITFLTYNYPSILLYVTPFIIIVFGGMWVLVSKGRN